MSLLLASEWPVARKEHQCDLCLRVIHPGEKYNRQRSIGDDGPFVFKDCAHCAASVKILDLEEGEWYDTDFGYTAFDLADFEPTTVRTARLKVMWRRQWRRRDGALYPVPEISNSPGQADPK